MNYPGGFGKSRTTTKRHVNGDMKYVLSTL